MGAVAFVVLTTMVFLALFIALMQNKGMFVSSSHFERVVSSSGYFDRMSPLDLMARHAGTKDEYKKRYMSAYQEFSAKEKEAIIHLVSRADKVLKEGFPRLHRIPWRFAKVGVGVEEGFPHTLGDIIVLSELFFMNPHSSFKLGTLIHEKVHLLQRADPVWVQDTIKAWGFRQTVPNPGLPKRNNPDLPEGNDYGLESLRTGGAIFQAYTTTNPGSLRHSQASMLNDGEIVPVSNHDIGAPAYVQQIEHPYEIMACMVPELLLKRKEPTTLMETILSLHMRT